MGSVAIKSDTGRSNQPSRSVARQTATKQSSKVRSILHAGSRGRLQAKLRISTPGDAYEQEADRVAEKVMRMPEPQPSASVNDSAPANSASHHAGSIQRTCASCAEDEELIQTKSAGDATHEMTDEISAGMESLRGDGRPLSGTDRSFFESRFGADFSNVRVHSGKKAAGLARSINARAFTVGQDIMFAEGQFALETTQGQQLMAHELTHVIQQMHDSRVAWLQRSEDEKGPASPPPTKPSGIVSTNMTRLQEVLANWEAALAIQGVSSPFVLEKVEDTAFHRITIQENVQSAIEAEAKRVELAETEATRGTLSQDRVYPRWALRIAMMISSDIIFDLSFVAANTALIPRVEEDEIKRVSMENPSGGDPRLAKVEALARQAQQSQLAGNPNAVREAQEQLADEGFERGPKGIEVAGVTVPTKALADKAFQEVLDLLMQEYDKARAEETAKARETDRLTGNADFTEGRPWAQKSREQVRIELEKLLEEQRSKHVEPGVQAVVQVFIDQRVGKEGGSGALTDLLGGDVDLGELVAHELAIHGAVYLPGSRATWLIPISDETFISRGLDRVQQAAYKNVQQERGILDVSGQHHWVLETDLEYETPKLE